MCRRWGCKSSAHIIVSAAGSDDRAFWDKADMKPYYVAKHYADEMLKHSNLNYTILRPVMLTDNDGTDDSAGETQLINLGPIVR